MTDGQIPRHWQHSAQCKTRSHLLQTRRELQLPDPSYDLDGDGVVDSTDLLVAKRFDHSGTGKLTTAQQEAARAAIETGGGLVWGCESSGVNRSFRVLQKRGVPVLGEDFTPVATTYPALSMTTPPVRTRRELLQHRRSQTLAENADLVGKLARDFRKEVPIEALVDYGQYNPHPPHFSQSQKQRENHRLARTAAGLAEPTSLSAAAELPLVYNPQPKFQSTQELKAHRKAELVRLTQVTQLNNSSDYSHQLDYQRLAVREAARLQPEAQGKTLVQIVSRRRSLDLDYNSRTFGVRPLGVHGIELPKFAEHRKEYWATAQSARSVARDSTLPEGKPQGRVRRGSLAVAEKPNCITQSPVALPIYQPRPTDFTDFQVNHLNQEHVLQREPPVRKKVKKPQQPLRSKVVFVRRLPKFNMAERLSLGKRARTQSVRTAGFKGC